MPAHNHTGVVQQQRRLGFDNRNNHPDATWLWLTVLLPSPLTINNTGGGQAHNHGFSGSATSTFTGNAINLDVQYVDIIINSERLMKLEVKQNCPMDKFNPCRQFDCAWFMKIAGTNPNNGEPTGGVGVCCCVVACPTHRKCPTEPFHRRSRRKFQERDGRAEQGTPPCVKLSL